MSTTFTYDAKKNILYEKGEGEILIRDFIKYRKELEQLGIKSGLRCIADYREAIIAFSFDEMLATLPKTENVTKGLSDIRVAICAPDSLGYGMARMYSSISNSEIYTVEVFCSVEEPCAWLEILFDPQ